MPPPEELSEDEVREARELLAQIREFQPKPEPDISTRDISTRLETLEREVAELREILELKGFASELRALRIRQNIAQYGG